MSLDMDIASLLSPFDGTSRGGVDLRDDDDPNNLYRQIRDARNEARDEERQSDINGESSASSVSLWRDVWENGQEYLRTCAKDLEIVAYMIEASIRLDGFAGLAQSLSLTRELLDNFWGELLPTPDEDGVETTLRPLSRLNGEVITYPLMRVPITDDTAVGQMVVWQYSQAKQLEALSPDERENRVSSGAVTLEVFNRAVAETDDRYFRRLAADIRNAVSAVSALQETLEVKVGDAEAPNLSKFVKSLEDADSILRQVAGNRLTEVSEESSADEVSGGEGVAVQGSAGGTATGGGGKAGIGSRNDAFNVLETVAVWFETHEPQSILPSEIRKAIRRGKMTPQELYLDLISDSEVRRQLFRDVGIENPEYQ